MIQRWRQILALGIVALCWPLSLAQAAVRSPCPRALRTNTNYQYRGELHFICLQLEPNSPPRLDVIQFRTSQLVWSNHTNELETNQLASFVDNEGTLRILLAVPNKINGTTMYSVDVNGRTVNETHTVNTQFVSTMAIWRLELNWEWHLATANQPYLEHLFDSAGGRGLPPPSPSSVPQPGPILTFHSWHHTYFDRYHSIELPRNSRVNKLEPMHINDQEFLIVATEPSSADLIDLATGRPARVNSLIYKLDFSTGALNWTHYQTLNTRMALDASSFLITHKNSAQVDYYIALVGQLQAGEQQHLLVHSLDVAEREHQHQQHGLIIFKYLGDRFVETSSVAVVGATKLDTISYGQGDSYVVVALLSDSPGPQISLFLFDGLQLKPMPSPDLNLAPASRHPGQLTSANRYRRTMDTNNLHLFRVPPNLADGDAANSTSNKRDLDTTSQNVGLPALVFSSLAVDDAPPAEADNRPNSSAGRKDDGDHRDAMYQIPVLEHIEPASGPTKRNFLAGLGQGSDLDLLGWCKSQLGAILNDKFESAAQQLASLPRVNQQRPIVIEGDLEIGGNLHVRNLLFAGRIIDESSRRPPLVNYLPLNYTKSMLDSLAHIGAQINQLKRHVDHLLLDDTNIPLQDVHVPLRFQRVTFECMRPGGVSSVYSTSNCPEVGELRSLFVNGRNVSDIQSQALVTGRSMVVGQEVRFEHLVLHGQTSIRESLNRLSIDEIVFGRGRRPIGRVSGHKSFEGGLYSSANVVVESWNGRRVDRQSVLTGTGEQRIEARLRFSELVLDSAPVYQPLANYTTSSRIEFLNGLHLDTHLKQIAQANEDNKFELPVSFDELVINGPTYLAPEATLAGVNLESLWASALFGHSPQNITAPMEFRNVLVSYGGDVQVDGLVNGLLLAPDNVMMRDRKYELDNPVVFESDVSVRQLFVEKALNGIQVFPNPDTNQYELAILYDGGRQLITGDKIFSEMRLGGPNNSIGGLINGHLNLTQLSSLLARNQAGQQQQQPFRFGSVRLARKLVRVADNVRVHIQGLINGVSANEICRLANSVASGEPQLRQYERLRFGQQQVVFKQLRCASINGHNDLGRHFLMRNANQRVAGTLRLVNGVVLNSTINIGATFNELNIEPLARSIAQVLNESRTSHKDFYHDLHIDSLNAVAINELELGRVFLAKSDAPQFVNAPMSFDHLDIENVLVVGHELTTHSFNGLNMSDIVTNTLQYDAPQVIYNHVELDNLLILQGSDLFTKSLNGHELSRLYSDAVLVDLPQQVLAPKRFRGPTEMTNRVGLGFGLDGLSERELKFNLLLQSDELIEDDVEFNNDVTIMRSLEIQTGLINDHDINQYVENMISEGQQGGGMRILGNSSLTFRDVKVKALILTGTIQDVSLPRDAIFRSNESGAHDARLFRDEQIRQNNQQLFNRLYDTGAPFPIQTIFRNQSLTGYCHIHSCPQTTPIITLPLQQARPATRAPLPPPAPLAGYRPVSPPAVALRPATRPPAPPYTLQPQPWPRPWPQPIHRYPHHPAPPVAAPLVRPHEPFMRPPRPTALVNTSLIAQVWTPVRPHAGHGAAAVVPTNDTHFLYQPLAQFPLADPKYLEYQNLLQAHAIQELAFRVNRYLPISFYYEIAQQHPDMGQALHAAESPVAGEQGYALLLFKEASRLGEPCLVRNQSVAVSSLQLRKGGVTIFTTTSFIHDTTRPTLAESLVVDARYHYLFVLDMKPRAAAAAAASNNMSPDKKGSQVLVYLWNPKNDMYDSFQSMPVDGYPVAMKAFVFEGRLACFALATPGLARASNNSGAPVLHCQESFLGPFSRRVSLAGSMRNTIDLDIVPLPAAGFGAGGSVGTQILVAALTQRGSEQIGDLVVARFDVRRESSANLLTKRITKPLKVHLVKRSARMSRAALDLVVSQGITSNDDAQATTHVISLALDGSVTGSQTIRDNQFVDIQSVLLDDSHSMIFMQSAHSISIYAPLRPTTTTTFAATAAAGTDTASCPSDAYQLIQRLPTKGANKFLVFNSLTNKHDSSRHNSSRTPFDHFLVLSTNDCEHQRYSTVVLKPHFR